MFQPAKFKKEFKEFIKNCDHEFVAQDLLNYFKSNTNQAIELSYDNICEAENYLEERHYEDIIAGIIAMGKAYTYITKRALFQNSKFLIRPTESELRSGSLISGHRFMPFCSSKVDIDDIIVSECGTDRRIDRKNISYPLDDLAVFYSLFGKERMMMELSKNKNNFEALLGRDITIPTSFEVSVFDMKEFYTKHSFKSGDYILVTVQDYEKAKCLIEYSPLKNFESRKKEVANWVLEFEKGLVQVINENKNYPELLTIEDELNQTFFASDKKLLRDPMIHIGGFLQVSKKVALKSNSEGVSLIWRSNEEIPACGGDEIDGFEDEDARIYIGNVKTLKDALEVMGYDLDEDELTAYIREELYNNGSFENFRNRCFDDRCELMYPELGPIFEGKIRSLWEKEQKKYDKKADEKIAELRKVILEIKDTSIKWQRMMDKSITSIDDVPLEEIKELAKIIIPITNSLTLLNKPSKVSPIEIKHLKMAVDKIKPIIEENIVEVYSAFQKPKLNRNFKIIPVNKR